MKRKGLISRWHDHEITAGNEWQEEINEHLNTAQIILLLISPDSIASDYCYDIEMTRALERHKAKEARVIPIILRPADAVRRKHLSEISNHCQQMVSQSLNGQIVTAHSPILQRESERLSRN